MQKKTGPFEVKILFPPRNLEKFNQQDTHSMANYMLEHVLDHPNLFSDYSDREYQIIKSKQRTAKLSYNLSSK
jgi:hypothetical protein